MSSQNKSFNRLNLIRNQLTCCQKSPLRVLVTGAAGNIGYALTFMMAQGRMFGSSQPIILHLFDLPHSESKLTGLKMELMDGSFNLLTNIVTSVDPAVAFKDIDYAILCGARPRSKGMERKDLLSANAKIFQEQGKFFEKYSKKTVKVCVVGNPANTNALMLSKNAPSINPKNFTALTRLDQNRAVAQISEKFNVANGHIKNITIWGNHSSTQYPDLDYASLAGQMEATVPLKSYVNDLDYVQGPFMKTVQQRGAEIIKWRSLSSAASAASAACDHVRDWFLGTAPVSLIF